ncbi:MAG: lipocalin-like domain-containing protein [Roseiflexaceae bacterium]|nr:lipocalin-like domain-containing protein [Roseiflexaceae bacterium]
MRVRPRLILALLALLLLTSCTDAARPAEPRASLSVAEALGAPADLRFARALQPRQFSFPADHGPHPEFAAEWWYYTGNLKTSAGRQFGFQLTFFRFGLTPAPVERSSAWAASNIYMAHFAVTDVADGQFYAFERFSRGAAGLAGAQGDPFQVWLEDWRADGSGPDGTPMRLQAKQGDVAIDLTLQAGKPAVLQGDQGLSQKSAEPGNASYYYSLTRMPTSGSVQTAAGTFEITGLAWMDREWSTSALAANQLGWDWFALQLDDGTELMYYRLRLRDGSDDPYSKGVLIGQDQQLIALARDEVQIEVSEHWRSPAGTEYPSKWRLRASKVGLDLLITPLIPNQELALTVGYWEGAVQLSGTVAGRSVSGNGYVELTGYSTQGSSEAHARGQ